ncbi:hypothetical protein Aperf_G00000073161 [Anoplocephala perfoliata]
MGTARPPHHHSNPSSTPLLLHPPPILLVLETFDSAKPRACMVVRTCQPQLGSTYARTRLVGIRAPLFAYLSLEIGQSIDRASPSLSSVVSCLPRPFASAKHAHEGEEEEEEEEQEEEENCNDECVRLKISKDGEEHTFGDPVSFLELMKLLSSGRLSSPYAQPMEATFYSMSQCDTRALESRKLESPLAYSSNVIGGFHNS